MEFPVNDRLDRRLFLQGSAAVTAAALASQNAFAETPSKPTDEPKICAFTKFLQDQSYTELSDTIKELGFDGVEATVRKKGHVLPENVEEDLPKLVEALKANDLEVTIMASDVMDTSELNQRVLKTAAGLGIKRYRMGFYRYDLDRPVMEQLEEIRPKLADLAAMNKELGMQALYQNHSGANFVGATLWDLRELIKDYPTDEIASAFDIRHTTIEAGLAWPVIYDMMKPNIGAIYVKDFQWEGKKAQHVPLGDGRVDPKFFQMLKANGYDGLYSLHVEYLKKEGVQANIDALRRDVAVLRSWIG
jgi:sugar phosphate isomerase/epimerase